MNLTWNFTREKGLDFRAKPLHKDESQRAITIPNRGAARLPRGDRAAKNADHDEKGFCAQKDEIGYVVLAQRGALSRASERKRRTFMRVVGRRSLRPGCWRKNIASLEGEMPYFTKRGVLVFEATTYHVAVNGKKKVVYYVSRKKGSKTPPRNRLAREREPYIPRGERSHSFFWQQEGGTEEALPHSFDTTRRRGRLVRGS